MLVCYLALLLAALVIPKDGAADILFPKHHANLVELSDAVEKSNILRQPELWSYLRRRKKQKHRPRPRPPKPPIEFPISVPEDYEYLKLASQVFDF
ncbi:unnamed protein product [Leptosia nina]|uniref:Uncharacterized protein n=1 Tax=Leptosia nina TaxID=320188 RepID=A0AAV1JL88_9NEOP